MLIVCANRTITETKEKSKSIPEKFIARLVFKVCKKASRPTASESKKYPIDVFARTITAPTTRNI
jgi:hypothetical protein